MKFVRVYADETAVLGRASQLGKKGSMGYAPKPCRSGMTR